MQILLTGCTGLLGNAVLPLLQSHTVTALVRKLPEVQDSRVTYLECDLGQPLDASKLPNRCDAIIHLAQSAHYRDFPNMALDIFQINTAATAALLDYAVKTNVKSFFYASTGSVYEPYNGPMDETALINPTTYYANSKLAAEKIIVSYQQHLKICIFRLFFLYGPGQRNSLIPNLITKIRNNHPIVIDGAEGLIFTPTFTHDVAQLIKLSTEEKWSGVFNVASPEMISIKDLSLQIGKSINRHPHFEYSGKPQPTTIAPSLNRLFQQCPTVRFSNNQESLNVLCK